MHVSLGKQTTLNANSSEADEKECEVAAVTGFCDPQATAAGEAWQKYETLTSSLSQELCEQLRLVLEPSQATKLK